MIINESSLDSAILIFGGELTGIVAIQVNFLGLFLLLTGVIGFCPIYTFFQRKK